jgi:hypothetical protein
MNAPMAFALSIAETSPAPAIAFDAGRPLCLTGLRIVVRRRTEQIRADGGCQAVVSLAGWPMTLNDRFRPVRGQTRGVPPGWTPRFVHGPPTGPKAWDSRTLAGNHEQEIYVDPAFPGSGDQPLGLDPFRRGRRGLTIRAWPTPAADAGRLWGYGYVSGLLTTHESFSPTYGYFEMKAKLPAGRGLWPAFWMAAQSGAWPPELDILEQTGGDDILQTVHMAGAAGPDQSAFRSTLPGATRHFHTYGVLWTPTRIVWFVDRRQTASAPTPPDLRQPLYLLLNLAIGGDFPGPPDASTRWPARLRISYVRAFGWPGSAGGAPP